MAPKPKSGIKKPTISTFLDTGVQVLNHLLTREDDKGIAIPRKDGIPSSIIAIKAKTGVGKSMFSSILAQKQFSWIDHPDKYADVIPLPIYYTFNHASSGIKGYINSVLGPQQIYPIFFSREVTAQSLARSGLPTLESFLNLFLSNPNVPTPEVRKITNINEFNEFIKDISFIGWEISADPNDYLIEGIKDKLNKQFEMGKTILPVIFLDPVNFFFSFEDNRDSVVKLFSFFRTYYIPLIISLEDAGESIDPEYRSLVCDIEFESDVLIELKTSYNPHRQTHIEVKKSRQAQPIFGMHHLRYESPDHHLSSVTQQTEQSHPGIFIFPSIHWCFSKSRKRIFSDERYFTGISKLDKAIAFSEEPSDSKSLKNLKAVLPSDSFILIRGPRGAHKLSVGFNLLAAGLWDQRRQDLVGSSGDIEPGETVMLVSLGEEKRMRLNYIGLSCNDPSYPNMNNSERIELTSSEPYLSRYKGKQVGEKITANTWLVDLLKTNRSVKGNTRMIEVTFRPGYIYPDEFLWVIESFIKHFRPSRMLIENSAYLQTSFPALFSESMLFTALLSLTRSEQVMMIVTDITEEGSDARFSFGLSSLADFVFDFSRICESERELINRSESISDLSGDLKDILVWSRMTISNIRRENLLHKPLYVSVIPCKRHSNKMCSRCSGEENKHGLFVLVP